MVPPHPPFPMHPRVLGIMYRMLGVGVRWVPLIPGSLRRHPPPPLDGCGSQRTSKGRWQRDRSPTARTSGGVRCVAHGASRAVCPGP